MRSSQNDSRCRGSTEKNSGGIPIMLEGFYREYQIRNFLNEPLYLVDAYNKSVIIQAMMVDLRTPHLEVRTRSANGVRNFDRLGHEVTTTPTHLISIPIEVLREGPIYLKEVDAVVCFETHLSIATHPHSVEAQREEIDHIYSKVAHAATEMPLTVFVNDPKREIDYIYTEIHGRICAARVTHFTGDGESDRVSVAYRDCQYDGEVHHREIKTTLTDLRKIHDSLWNIDGYWFSSNHSLLSAHIAAMRGQSGSDTIPVDEHLRIMTAMRDADQKSATSIKQENESLRKQLGRLESLLKSLKDINYSDQNVDVVLQQLTNDQLKAQAATKETEEATKRAQLKADADLRLAEAKSKEELFKTGATVAKTIAVVVPVLWTLYVQVGKIRKG